MCSEGDYQASAAGPGGNEWRYDPERRARGGPVAALPLVETARRRVDGLVWRRTLDDVLGAGLVDVIDSSEHYEVRIWYPCGCTARERVRCRYAVDPCDAHESVLRASTASRG